MKHLLQKTCLMLVCLIVGVGTTWATDVVYKTAKFGTQATSGTSSGYTSTYTSVTDGFSVSVANGNTNGTNWNCVKFGRKGSASVGSITTSDAIDKAITKVVLTIDAITAANVNSIKLYTGATEAACTTEVGTFSSTTGDQTVNISSPAANKFYKISIDCKSGSGNGFVAVSKVAYYYDDAAGGDSGDGDSEETITINMASLTNPNTTSTITYGTYNWTSGTVSGVYNGASSSNNTSFQFNYSSSGSSNYRDKQALYNTVAVPGKITSIKMVTASGSARTWTPYVSSSAITPANYTSATALTAKSVNLEEGTTWAVTGNNSYFYLNYTTGSVSYIGDIVITYTTDGGDPDPEKTPTSLTWSASTATATIGASNSYPTLTTDPVDLEGVTYDSSDKTVATIAADGTISLLTAGTTTITASYAGNETYAAATDATYILTVNAAPKEKHDVRFYVNGSQYGETQNIEESEAITFPADPTAPEEHVFIGWKKGGEEVTTPQAEAIATVDKAAEIMGTENVTYYAVWAVQSGSGEANYTKLSSNSFDRNAVYVLAAEESSDESTLHYFSSYTSTTANERWGVTSTNVADAITFTLSGTAGALVAKDASGNYIQALTTGYFRMSSSSTTLKLDANGCIYNPTSGNTYNLRYNHNNGSGGFRWYNSSTGTSAYFYKKDAGTTYTDYCTTVSLDPKPTIVLTATELAEYVGNTSTSITASVSEGEYTGALTVESSAEDVATASISEGTITINALTAGSATITVTAPAVAGFRKNTATIAVTVSEKLAHGLSFSTDVLNLTVGDIEFSEPTLNNPNTLPVVYSLVYATPANEGKVATINAETGKLTLADPSLSTETQGAVTVKASTVGDNSHVAGEVTYNLVVARKVTTTSWSNEGAAVTIDKDEIATLPTASNDGERNLFYESSNTDVATIDNTGAVAFVAYGTTTITVKTSATAEYAATSATYELTFAPRYTVTFSINGEETERREETTGAGVVAPTVEPIEGKVFRGWAEATIDGTTDVAPTFVTTSTLDEDKTLYAVFATVSEGEDFELVENLANINEGEAYIGSYINYSGSRYYVATSATDLVNATVTNKVLTIPSNAIKLTFVATGTANEFYIKNEDDKFLNVTSSDWASFTTTACALTFSGSSPFALKTSTGNNYLRAYASSATSGKLKRYASQTNTGICVFQKSKEYSDYCTTVKTTPTLSFAEATYNATVGGSFDAPTLTNEQNVTVSYSSSEESVATIDSESGAITLVGAGTTTITATFAGNETYNETSASYELVVAPVFTTQTLNFKAQNDDGYYATFSSSEVTFFTADVVVSAVGVENTKLSLYSNGEAFDEDIVEIEGEEVTGYYVPANTGILVYSISESTTYYAVTGITPSDAIAAVNKLVPCTSTGIFKEEADENYYYKLAYGDNTNKTKLGFWWGAADGSGNFNVKAGGAVLVVPQSAGVRGFSFTPDGVLTGVNSVGSDNNQNAIYNLQGMRMLKVQRGVNIVNGRKVIR